MFARDQQSLPFVEQWARTDRWWRKLQDAYGSDVSADEVMDLFYAVFQNVFAMRDWLVASQVDKANIEALFSTESLQLCRDIANGTKHCKISRATKDASFIAFREYDPRLKAIESARTEVFFVIANGRKFEMFCLVLCCMADIQSFLIRGGLFGATSQPFCDAMRQGFHRLVLSSRHHFRDVVNK